MLNKRTVEILRNLINKNNAISLEELANKYDLSERSIRYDVENINFFLKINKFKELTKVSKGIFELKESGDNLENILELVKNMYYTFSPIERLDFIKAYFFFSKKPLKAKDLEQNLSISNSTARADLNEAKSYFENLGMKVNYHPKKGFILSGDEECFRKEMLKFLFQYFKVSRGEIRHKSKANKGLELILSNIKTEIKDISLVEVTKFIKLLVKDLKTNISDEASNILRFYFIILINRIEDFHFLEGRTENESFLKDTEEYSILKNRLSHFETTFGINLNKSEILFLTELLLGSHSYNFNTSLFKHWIELENLVKNIIKEVGRNLDIDFSKDTLLQSGLVNHLKPALYRMKHDLTSNNNIAEEVKVLYKDYYDAVKKSCNSNLQSHIGRKIPREEVACLTIHFKMAIDRVLASYNPKNLLLICSFGYGTTKLLADQLTEVFNVNIVKTMPYHKLSEVKDLSNIDYILTTLDINEERKDIPILKISPLLGEDEKNKLLRLGLQRKKEVVSLSKLLSIIDEYKENSDKDLLTYKLQEVIPINVINDIKVEKGKSLNSFIKKENIDIMKSVKTWEEAIEVTGNILVKNRCSTPSYTKAMVNSIKSNGSYMVINDYVAIPHASAPDYVLKSGFSILVLEEPIKFPEDKEVSFIVSFSSSNPSEHSDALIELVDIVDDKKFQSFLKTKPSKELILNYLYS